MDGSSRAEHLAWAKQRALEYLPHDTTNAFNSMVSDLGKHPELAGHIGIELGAAEFFGGMLQTPAQMRHWIEGFN